MKSTQSLGTVSGMPISLVLCAAALLVPPMLLVGVVAWCALRRVREDRLPATLLGLAHVISALGGLLPWGRPTPSPLPHQPADGTSIRSIAVLAQGDTTDGVAARGVER